MSNNKSTAVGVLLAVVLAFGVGLYSGVTERGANAQTITVVGGVPTNVDMGQFWQAWAVLNTQFVQTHASGTIPTDQEKVYGAIKGLTDSFGDPYTVFFPPADAKVFNEDVSGSFGGVGMEMGTSQKGDIQVIAPLKDSPAQAAGILAGDIITSIGATSTAGMTTDQAVKLIRGPVGTQVTLGVLHKEATKPVTITITRQTIIVPIIDAKDEGGVYTISLYSFSESSATQFQKALRTFMQSGDTRLILDLRGNPGGYLEAAVQMASYFLPVGETIVTEDTKGRGENVFHRSIGYNVFANKKLSMAVLVDQGSASASEILAGALQQHGVAKLVGTRTFGKGSVQQLVDLGGGAELKITIARWLTPNGTSISEGGITPDIKVERTADDIKAGKDPQLDAAKAWLATQ
jgi:carboxyl-terminal processing protease